jgi:Bacterial Ig-like domain
MSFVGYKTMVAFLVGAALAGCAGNGQGLDSNGNPVAPGGGSTTGPITADLQSIQDNVFTPICSKCHIGGGAPKGLMLDQAHAYMDLVGVASVEEPQFQRVQASDPDSSYMIMKIEGASGIQGGQMPLGETPLPQTTINMIRQWVTNGAQPAAAAAAVKAAIRATVPPGFSVMATSPDNDTTVPLAPPQVVVGFTDSLDPNLLSNSTVTLESNSDASGSAATALPVKLSIAPGNPTALLISPLSPLANGSYRVTLHGSLADMNAQALGSDYSFTFTVDAPQ